MTEFLEKLRVEFQGVKIHQTQICFKFYGELYGYKTWIKGNSALIESHKIQLPRVNIPDKSPWLIFRTIGWISTGVVDPRIAK